MSRRHQNEDGIQEEVLQVKRVSKKTKGGNYATFTVLVAVGDGKGNVGIGVGKGLEVPPAIRKAITKAKKQMFAVPLHNTTIPHQVVTKFKSAKILLKPAPEGSGLKVGGVARTILELSGIQNASGKIIGTRNHTTNAHAVVQALKELQLRT